MKKDAKSQSATPKKLIELEYVMKNVKFDVEFDPNVFDEDEQQELREYVNVMSKEIPIDKTYVEFNGNPRKSAFMREDGWNELKYDIVLSNFCKKIQTQNTKGMADAFATIARCYMYECLSLKTKDVEHINCTLRQDQEFDLVICEDVGRDFERYVGPWQTWEFDDNGNFKQSK